MSLEKLYTLLPDLPARCRFSDRGTHSETVFEDDSVKAVLFSFAAGEELSEHTASRPAVLHFLRGSAEVTLGPDAHEVEAGAWIHMPARLPHAIRAREAVGMLLLLFKAPRPVASPAGSDS